MYLFISVICLTFSLDHTKVCLKKEKDLNFLSSQLSYYLLLLLLMPGLRSLLLKLQD